MYCDKLVKAGRKQKWCANCDKTIKIGEPSWNVPTIPMESTVSFCLPCYEVVDKVYPDLDAFFADKKKEEEEVA